jgi:hypothetical protein
MLNIRNAAHATILVACFVAQLSAQAPEITVGRLTVSVGMSHAEVVRRAELARQRLSVQLGHERTAVVWEEEAVDDLTRALGSIVFKDGRVMMAFKKWTLDPVEKDVDVGNALFAVAASFVRDRNTNCTLSTKSREEPGQQEQQVIFQCGRRAIMATIVRIDEHRLLTTTVSESIQ